MSSQLSPHAIATRARNALWVTFLIMGFVVMAWVPRIPEIKESLGLSSAQFGFVLVGSSCGAVLGAQLAGRLIHTYGSRRVISVAIVIVPIALVSMGNSQRSLTLFISLFAMGLGYSAMDIAANTQAVAIEKILQKRWMSSFHALWSVGAFITTVVGGVIAKIVSPQQNLLAIALFSLVAFVPLANYLLPTDLDEHNGGAEETKATIPFFANASIPLWAIGCGLLGALIAEGSASDWGGILLYESMSVGKGANASAFGSFALAMIVSRFAGDRILERLGPSRTVRLGGFIGGIGWGAAIAIAVPLSRTHPAIALVVVNLGFMMAGLGMGPMVPAFIVAASEIPGIASSVAIARIGVIGIAGYFMGPTITGLLAQSFNLPIAMAFPVMIFILAGFMSRAIPAKNIAKAATFSQE